MQREFEKEDRKLRYRLIISGFSIVLIALGLFFTIKSLETSKDKITNFLDGDPANIVKLYYEQSNDPSVIQYRNTLNNQSTHSLILSNILNFPNGTPIQNAFKESGKTGTADWVKATSESKLPNEIGVPKAIKEETSNYFNSYLEFNYKGKRIKKLRVNIGEIISPEIYLGEKFVSVETESFISVSYDVDTIKYISNNKFKAVKKGTTKIGVLYFDGKEIYVNELDVIVNN